ETWYRLLAEFYQLILHLPSLGRNGLRYAEMANEDAWWWKATHQVQRFAVWLLTVPAVLLNVVLLSLGVITLSAEIPSQYQSPAAIAIAALMLAGAAIVALRALKLRRLLWMTWPLIVAGSAAAAYLTVPQRPVYEVLALEATVVAALASLFIAIKYSVMKRTAKRFGFLATAAMAGTAVYFIWGKVANEAGAYVAAVETAQRLYPFVVVAWLLVFASGIAAALCGIVAALKTPKERRSAAWRTIWTARFSLGMPAALFTIFTLSIWYLVLKGITSMSADVGPMLHAWKPAFFMAEDAPAGLRPAGDLMMSMLLDSTRGLEVFVGALAFFVVAALFAAIPSVVLEVKPAHTSTDEESTSLGTWLSSGIRIVAGAAEVFTLAFVMLLLINVYQPWEKLGADQLGLLLSASAAVVAALLMSKRFIKTFRAAVDVLLDVDNYLRESPRDATPRARIAERFVSLLRHLCAEGYERIVLVAHSQGTVISADALRYLRAVPDPDVTGVPIRLYTMGSPLRQLYAAAFPYLYSWIDSPAAMTPAEAPKIPADAPPAPAMVNVQVWANVYRSGDYVGRHLWLEETYARLWIRKQDPNDVARDDTPTRVQFCIGAGAHTHYWNKYGKDVGTYLDELIG
ncbi:MAG TPA: hypothetical protein VHK90_15980, partial [Thermoanaerobaculia bacterium]|nr:hypothetical protein [Thermoanaerobaculia bacterium]